MKHIILALTSVAAFTMFTCVNANAQIITTIAGNGASAYSGDHGVAINASLHMPVGVAFDTANNMYVNDNFNLCVRKVDKYGIITTFAGNGTSGYSGDGGPATAAQISVVGKVATDNLGNVYIVDPGNDVIRKVDAAGIITTVVGNGVNGYTGDNGPATAAELNLPQSVALDNSGNLYIADGNNNCIRKVNTLGIISTIAGNGTEGYRGDGGPATASVLNSPEAVTVDHAGNVYIADYINNRIRKINAAGMISTVAGNGAGGYSGDGGAATSAKINSPADVSVDNLGNIYIADGNNVIRMVNNAGIIATVVGNGDGGFSGDGGSATAAKLNNPECVTVDNFGAIYIADANNNRVRKVVTCAAFKVSPIFSTGNSVCLSANITLSDNTEGSVWSASNSNATVTSGVVSGITAGSDTIFVSVSNSCGAKDTFIAVNVNALPDAGSISGFDSVCMGTTTSLTSSATGGIWNATTGAATIAGGDVTGVTAGTDTIMYTVSNTCGTATAAHTITVNPLPVAGIITGDDSIDVELQTVLSDTVALGIWTSSNNTIATISGTGKVLGVASGIDTIIYAVTNTCGTAVALKKLVVDIDGTTGIKKVELLSEGMQIYPNPAKGFCNVAVLATATGVKLIDALGRVVVSKQTGDKNMQQIAIDLKGVVPGTYIVSIECTEGVYNQKLEVRD